MRTTSRCLALVIAILSFGLPMMVHAQTKPDATRILNNMFRVYSRLTSYQDEGMLVITSEEATGGRIEKMPFKTFFKRPNLFRFEWTEFTITKLGRTNGLWFNGKEAFTYWEPDRYEQEESLRLAVAGAGRAWRFGFEKTSESFCSGRRRINARETHFASVNHGNSAGTF